MPNSGEVRMRQGTDCSVVAIGGGGRRRMGRRQREKRQTVQSTATRRCPTKGGGKVVAVRRMHLTHRHTSILC